MSAPCSKALTLSEQVANLLRQRDYELISTSPRQKWKKEGKPTFEFYTNCGSVSYRFDNTGQFQSIRSATAVTTLMGML